MSEIAQFGTTMEVALFGSSLEIGLFGSTTGTVYKTPNLLEAPLFTHTSV